MVEKTPQTPPQQARVTRTELPAPDLADPERVIIQVQYQVGELPPHFIFIPKKEWNKEREAKDIKADLSKRMSTPGEVISF